MIKTTTREIASSSDVNAPVFYFKEYVRGLEYHNNGRQIDFVTDGNSLYVPSTDNVTACKDSIKEDGGFMRLVSEGKQGIQGLKGDPGRDGRTPSVFARFDGRQMIFYTNEINEDGTPKIDDKGNPVTRRIAATNDLTGPSWRPKKVDDTIIWEKTRDDSQPESINLSDLVKETAPVIFRVDSDNTKRTDETSGPANYIQWKYEGDEYWNNLISISELMNLALAGVCIWFDETDQEYHLGHRQVLHATYDSSKSGKRIISDVEHGDVLYDAGPIHLPDFEADIAALWEEVCALKDRVDAIEEELPKFVKAVIINDKLNKPDEDGVVDLGAFDFYTKEESDEKFQPVGDYIKKSDLKFEVRNEENGRFLYMSLDNGSTWTKIYEATCVCKKEEDPTVYYTIFFETPTPSTATMTYSGTVKYPGSQVRVPAGTTVVLEADAEGYKHYKETKLINADYHFAPVLTEESAPEVKYSACVIDKTDLADRIYIGTTSANKQQACLENLSNGTTVYGKATRSGYKDKNVSGVINNDNLELHITGEWESSSISVTGVSINDGKNYTMCLSDAITHTFKATVTPSNATNKSVKWRSVNPEYLTINETTGLATPKKTTDTLSTGYVTVIARTDDGGHEAECKVVIEDCSEPGPETTLSVDPSSLTFDKNEGNQTFTVTTNADGYNVEPECDWITFTKSGNTVTINVSANTGSARTCSVKVTAGDKEVSIPISQDSGEVTPITHTLTINGNGAESITVNGNNYTEPMEIEEGTHIDIVALRNGYTASYSENNFDMVKDTWININWTADTISVDSISLDKSTMSLTYASCDGNTYGSTTGTLTATISPSNASNKGITWSSSNTSVATVNTNGVVTAKKTGSATITATAQGNTSKKATCTVTVTAASVPTSTISLNKQSAELTVGGTETLTATRTPSCATDTISWTSRDTNIVTVSGGTITAKATGTTTITAKANGKSATCEVTVKAATVDVTSVEITNCGGAIRIDETTTLGVTVKPDNATNKDVTWSSDNTAIATVENGVVTGKGVGQTIIRATSVSNSSATNTCVVNVRNKTVPVQISNDINCPADKIYINGNEYNYADSANWIYVEPGTSVTMKATRSGYKDVEKTKTMTATDHMFTINCSDWESTTPQTVLVDNISLNTYSRTINVGDTFQLTATISPSNATNKNINWNSSNSQIASVSATGLVRGVSEGTVNIHANSVDGNAQSESCLVTVIPTPKTIVFQNNWTNAVNAGINTSSLRNVAQGRSETITVGTNDTFYLRVTPDDIPNPDQWQLRQGTNVISDYTSARWPVIDIDIDSEVTFNNSSATLTLEVVN